MNEHLSDETWRELRQQARDAADQARRQQAEQISQQALQELDLPELADLEARLQSLSGAWAVHQKPLLSRLPLVGPLLDRLGRALLRFLLQHQVGFNAELARILQQSYQLQQWTAQQQIARSDALFAELEQHLLGLEARLRDLEDEVRRLQQQ